MGLAIISRSWREHHVGGSPSAAGGPGVVTPLLLAEAASSFKAFCCSAREKADSAFFKIGSWGELLFALALRMSAAAEERVCCNSARNWVPSLSSADTKRASMRCSRVRAERRCLSSRAAANPRSVTSFSAFSFSTRRAASAAWLHARSTFSATATSSSASASCSVLSSALAQARVVTSSRFALADSRSAVASASARSVRARPSSASRAASRKGTLSALASCVRVSPSRARASSRRVHSAAASSRAALHSSFADSAALCICARAESRLSASSVNLLFSSLAVFRASRACTSSTSAHLRLSNSADSSSAAPARSCDAAARSSSSCFRKLRICVFKEIRAFRKSAVSPSASVARADA
mmetsp:Transcript_23749/g.60135  ORF Transcript_23749/g.60135 Transcript_23749/m.60135 type:complete len:355 (-) Transcript_23749:1158-2222(-)